MGLASNISRVGQFAQKGGEFLGATGLDKATLVGQVASKVLKGTAKVAPKLAFLVSKKDELVKEGKELVKAVKEKDVAKGFGAVGKLASIGKEAAETKEYKKKKEKAAAAAAPAAPPGGFQYD